MSSAVSGLAMFSSVWRSALIPRNASAIPPITIIPAPSSSASSASANLPVLISDWNTSGPVMPPIPVPTA